MGTEKRERQKQGRQLRLEEQRTTEKRSQRFRQIRGLVLVLVAVLGVALLISVLSGGGDDDVSTDAPPTTEPGLDDGTDEGAEPAEPPEPVAREFAYGSTPCPAAEGAERVISFDDGFERCIEDGVAYRATIETTAGTVVVELDTADTPGTANNFVALARHGYYDDTVLFRTDPSIGIIQGGSPTTQSAADPGPGYTITDEGAFVDDPSVGYLGPYTYEPGQLVMARSAGPDAAGAQFFVTVTDAAAALDAQGTYVVFGRVTEGLDVLEAILDSHVDDPESGLGGAPDPEVTVTSVTISES